MLNPAAVEALFRQTGLTQSEIDGKSRAFFQALAARKRGGKNNHSAASGGIGTIACRTFAGDSVIMKFVVSRYLAISLLVLEGLSLPTVDAQIFVASTATGSVNEYTTAGQPISTPLVAGLTYPVAVAVAGGQLFVADLEDPNGISPTSQVRVYSAANGAVINPVLFTFYAPINSLVAADTQLYLAADGFADYQYGEVQSYFTSGQEGTVGFNTTYPIYGFVLLGSTAVVGLNLEGRTLPTTDAIYTYGLDGTAIAAPLVPDLPDGILSLASDGTNIYASDSASGTVSEYSASGEALNPNLITGLNNPIAISIDGEALFVLTGDGTVSEYTTSGQIVNTQLISGISGASSFTVVGPVIQDQPQSVQVAAGDCASLYAGATGQGTLTYQWLLNGVPISGATDPYLFLPSVSDASVGSYICNVTDGSGVTTATTAAVVSEIAGYPGSIINLSVRANSGPGSAQTVAGFIVTSQGAPNASVPVLVRAVGPTLANFGVSGPLPDPSLTLYQTSPGPVTVLASNAGWDIPSNNPAAIEAAEVLTGAFQLPSGSADAALIQSFQAGAYTENVVGLGGDTGVVLAELYDASSPPGSSSAHLSNVSGRATVTGGSGALIAGFAINGSTEKTLLIRATGPGLAPFGISGPLDHPLLSVYAVGSSAPSQPLRTNASWNADPVLSQVAGSVNAFSQTSGDAALLITLPPGLYTANVTSGDNTSGVALVEVYEVQ